jgi:hypothetical protein
VGYISTGGGAFLEVLEGKTLPAFEISVDNVLQTRLFGLPDETYLANSVTLATVGGPGGVQPNFGPTSGAKQAVAAVLNAAYFGARYPVQGYQNPLAVIAAFKACFSPRSLRTERGP